MTDIPNLLGDFLYNIMMALFYPISKFFDILYNFMSSLLDSLLLLYSALTGFGNNAISVVSDFITGLLPFGWVFLLLLALGLIVIKRVYKYLKDISILGNSV